MNINNIVQMTVLALSACASTSHAQVVYEDFKLGVSNSWFHASIDIDNGVVGVGAWASVIGSPGGDPGYAFLYDAATGSFFTSLIHSDEPQLNDGFGSSISIDNGVVTVGVPADDDNGLDSGSAYVFNAATGAQLAKLLPSDGDVGDRFGSSIAISNSLVVVGASRNDDNGLDSGSAYVFNASTGAQLTKLLPSDGAAGDFFGTSIAIQNGIVAVGARYDDDNGADSGSVYLFDAATGVQLAKLLPDDGDADDLFGCSIAIENCVVAVGAYGDDDNGTNSGSVYLFDTTTGAQLAKLFPSDGAAEDHFGRSIGIGNGVVAVGASGYESYPGGPASAGSAYLFNTTTGEQLAKLLPSDGAPGDHFAWNIAIDSGVVAVVASYDFHDGFGLGSVYLFTLPPPPTIHEDLKLLPYDGAPNDSFGNSIAIDNGVVAVGAAQNSDYGTESGSAYLFDTATGVQLLKLLPSEGAQYDNFGASIAIANGVVAVGVPGDDDNGFGSGSAYLFDAATGVQLVKLRPNDGGAADFFGSSIAISNGVVAVGAYGDDDNGFDSGSAYLFDAATGAQLIKLLPDDGSAYASFGNSIAIDNGKVAVGAYYDDDNGVLSGSAYLFNAATGEQLAKLLPNDGAAEAVFGFSIDIEGNFVVVGSVHGAFPGGDNSCNNGAAYLFDASTGTQISKLLPTDGAQGDDFGISISIDNGLVVIGARFDDYDGFDSGSAYLFDATTGTQLVKLIPSDGGVGDRFGQSIAIDNDVVVIGSVGDDENGFSSGSASIFMLPPPAVNQDLKLLPKDGAANDSFGESIAIDDGVIAVGMPYSDDSGLDSGSAYLFDASTGVQLAKLVPDNGGESDHFGFSIAIDNGIVAVGSPMWVSGVDSGTAYLFDIATGEQFGSLLAPDGAAGDRFGWSIAISNGIVAVGALTDDEFCSAPGSFCTDIGSVYLYDAVSGGLLAKLLPDDGEDFDNFGSSIAINNGIVAIGAAGDSTDNGLYSGSVYLFNAITGTQLIKLLPSDGDEFDHFGHSIAIDNGIVAVGLPNDADNGVDSGAVYLFDAATGAQLAKILPNDGAAFHNFGSSLALDSGVLAIGAWGDSDNGIESGAAYLFDVATVDQLAKLRPTDGAPNDILGISIAIDDGTVVVGAPGDNDNGPSAGSAYLFTAPIPSCLADLVDDGVLNFFDVSAFLVAYAAHHTIADFNNDGVYDFFDVSVFLSAFNAGCD